jgi:hypothetical protein
MIAKTAHWRTCLSADGKALEIESVGAGTGIVIGLADLAEYQRLITKARGLLELKRTVELPDELAPDNAKGRSQRSEL